MLSRLRESAPRGRRPRTARGSLDGETKDILQSSRCNIYVEQPAEAGNLTDMSDMEHRDIYAVHWWLQRSLAVHPWRVHERNLAQVVFFNASFTYSRRGTTRHRKQAYKRLRAVSRSHAAGCEPAWFASALSRGHAPVPWLGFGPREFSRPSVHWIREVGEYDSAQLLQSPVALVAPTYIVTAEQYMTSADSLHARQWIGRKTLLLAGHVPAVHISDVRWNMWRLLHGDYRATLVSHTLIHLGIRARACNETCDNGEWDTEIVHSFLMKECIHYCRSYGDAFFPDCGHQSAEQVCFRTTPAPSTESGHAYFAVLQRHCNNLLHHRVAEVMRASPASFAPVRMNRSTYLSTLVRHKVTSDLKPRTPHLSLSTLLADLGLMTHCLPTWD